MLREDRTVWLDAPLIPARPALCHTPSALLPPPSTRGPGGLGVAWHAAQPHVQQPRALMQPCGDMPVRRPNAARDLRPCEVRPRRLATCPCFSPPSGTGRLGPGCLRPAVLSQPRGAQALLGRHAQCTCWGSSFPG